MDIQFNEQFVRTKFLPTLKTLLTRMGQPVGADPKGSYLGKLLIPRELNAEERKSFNEDYFLGVQPENRAFTGENDQKYRDGLLNGLAGYLRQQKLLRGDTGIRSALIPTEGRSFESNPEMVRNLNLMAHRLISGFEKTAVVEQRGEMTAEETEKLENGGFKLVNINGQDRVIDSAELDNMEPGTVIKPFVPPGVYGYVSATTQTSSSALVTVTVADFSAAFDEARVESAKELLETAGLEIVRMTIEGDVIRGVIRDVSGQLLSVEINSLSANSDPRKIKFTFRDPVRDQDDNRAYRDRYFYTSQNDLQPRFLVNGQRQTAENVYLSLPLSARFKGFELPPRSVLPGETFPPRMGTIVPKVPAGQASEPVSAPSSGEIPATSTIQTPKVPGLIPKGGPLREAQYGTTGQRAGDGQGIRGGAALRGKKGKKEAPKDQEQQASVEQQQAQQQQQDQQQQPPAPPLRVGDQQRQQQMAERSKSGKKNQRRTMALLAGGSAGIVTASPGLGLLFKYLGSSGAEETQQTARGITFLLECLGNSCLC